MKRLLIAVFILTTSTSVHAQISVIDPANLAENIRQLVQMELEYARQLEQLCAPSAVVGPNRLFA